MRVLGGMCKVGLAAALLTTGVRAQDGVTTPSADSGIAPSSVATVTFTFNRPGLAVPRYRFVVREDGTGMYAGEEVPASGQGAGDASSGGTATPLKQDIALNPATTAKIFKEARGAKFFNGTCASKAKNIADTGSKTLAFEGPDGKGACAYNFSENKDVVALTDLFVAISTTLEEGRRLEAKRRFDHLGLDAELDVLTQANEGGRAVELNTIAPVLRELAGDTEMMQRVRLRAAKLLDRAADGK